MGFLAVFLVFLYGFLLRKYQNPYKCIFIFGKKGSGKSCYMVRQMHRYLKKGWNVYTDMSDVRIPGVRIVTLETFDSFKPEPHSLICLDEVGISMDNRSFKSFPPGRRDFFKYARKMKCRIIMNSQSYDVDKKVRDTVDGMLLAQSIGLFTLMRPITRSITLTAPTADSESRIADTLRFSWIFSWRLYYMPAYFRYFDSLAMPPRPDASYRLSKAPERLSKGPLYNLAMDVMICVKTIPSRLIRH